MASVENRVVSLTFNNAQFEAAVAKTLASLTHLDNKLKLEGAANGLDNVGRAASRLSLEGIASSVDRISSRFSAMGVVAATALSNITNRAITAGAAIVKSLTIAPVTAGFQEYETNLNSIQTILANTAAAGTNLKDVNATLAELNHYSDQTIYNFSEMARNIGTFTAAGVDLKTSASAIKGIANLAALSGSNSQQAAGAMYQLSQAISSGRVSLEDWNSVVNAGMGGTVFQRALAQTAEKMGTLDKGAVKLTGSMKNVTIGGQSFRESITARPGEESWLTSEVLTSTLSQFTGDLSDAQLAAQGFNSEQIKAIQQQAKMAKNAATQVKTFSQLLGTLSESAGSGWTQTWQYIFGDFEEAKSLFTSANNVLGGFINRSAEARNKVLKDWKELGGRTVMIEAVSNAFKALVSFVTPIKDAFREIFPAKTGKDLYDLSVSIRNFTEGLIVGSETADKLKRTFAGVFAIFGIGVEIIKQVLGVFVNLFSEAKGGSGGFLDLTAGVGDFLVKLHDAVVNGTALTTFFKGLTKVLSFPIKAFQLLATLISSAFSSSGSDGVAKLSARLEPFGKLGQVISKAWSKIGDIFSALTPLAGQLGDAFGGMGDAIQEALANINFDHLIDSINTGLFAALVLAIRNFTSNASFSIFGGGDDGIIGTIKEAFGGLTDTLSAMQAQLKAGTLIKIAGAIALLTASVVALSLLDSNKLAKSLTAITIMFAQLAVAMGVLTKVTSGSGILKLPALAAALIGLALAIDILAVAVYALSQLSWEELVKGLGSVVILIGALVLASKGMDKNSKGMIKSAAGLILMATAIKILASAMKDLSGLSWSDMAQGLVGVAAILAALALYTKFASVDKGGALSGAGLLLLAVGIKILASALQDISDMSWEELARGLVGMAGGLTAMGAALMLIPPSSILSAAAVLVAATALNILSSALSSMAEMSWEDTAQGLVTLAGALGIIAAAMYLMTGALPGAAALLVVSASLAVLAPILVLLGGMSWTSIAAGLTMLAGALTIIGIAGVVLTPVVPVLLGLGAAVALLGVGMLAAGGGLLLFAAGLTALSVAGAAGAAALVGIVTTLLGAVPQIMQLVGEMMIGFAQVVQKAAPEIGKMIMVVMTTFLDVIIKMVPKIASAAGRVILGFLGAIKKYVPRIVVAGSDLLISFLNALTKQIPRIATAATNVIVAFLGGIQKNLPRIIHAGAQLIISFINGLATEIRNSGPELGAAAANLGTAIIEGMVKGLASGVGVIASKAKSVAQSALNAAKSVLGINSPSKEFEKIGRYVNDGFVKGLEGNSSSVTDAFNKMKTDLKDLMRSSSEDVDRLEKKLKRLTSARKKDRKEIAETRKELAQARKENTQATRAYGYLTKYLTDERDKLKKLANQYDKITAQLDAANQKLKDAKKVRDDYKKSITDQYSDLPDITNTTKLEDFRKELEKQILDTKAYTAMLDKLRKLGLNDHLYQELVSKGPEAGMGFASQLLDGGKQAVTDFNKLDKSLTDAAAKLGTQASTALYQAAVNSAQGLVDGLKKQQKAIEKQMEKIAEAMIKAIKKKLKIKSPSREFAEVGEYSAKGLAVGLDRTSNVVQRSAENMGKEAIFSLQKSISGIRTLLDQNVDMQPSIRPVIDLTQVKKDAGALIGLIPDQVSIDSTTAYAQAKSVRAAWDAILDAKNSDPVKVSDMQRLVQFTQYNYSPKALSPAEIYRQTSNQLSKARGALSTS